MNDTLTIELFYFDGCPNHEPVAARLPELLDRAGATANLELVRVESDEDAQRVRFLGSPTLRIGGRDVEPGAADRNDFGLKCRLYRTPDGLRGVPPDEWILAALGSTDGGGGDQPADRTTHSARADALLGGQFAKTRVSGASGPARALHRRVIRSFLAGRPPKAPDLDRWVAELGGGGADALAELERRDLVLRDAASGDVATAYPFSGVPTAHSVRLEPDRDEVFAMCAIDALGIPFLARQPAEIRSRAVEQGEAVRISITPDGSTHAEPADVMVVVGRTGDGPSVAACCPYLNFVADRAAAESFVAATPGLQGEVLDLADAVALGRELFESLIDDDVA